MSVQNKNTVDAISINLNLELVLTIFDHLEWDIDNTHLLMLQDKINTYLAFIESGEIYEHYAEHTDKPIRINIMAKFNPSATAKTFLERAKETIESAGFRFSFNVIEEQSSKLKN